MTEELPPGWVETTVGDVCLPVSQRGPSSDRASFRYIDLGAMDNKKRRIADAKSIPIAEAPSRAKQIVRARDVVFSTVRVYLENIGLVPPELDGEIASTAFCVLRPARGIDPRYLYYYVTSRPFIISLNKLQRGNSPPSVQDGDVRRQSLPIAPSEEQGRIASKIDELFSRIDEGERALERVSVLVERYRQSVLKAAVTGELTRAWREKNKESLESGEALLSRILTARREAWEKAELEKMKAKGITPASDKWKQKYEEPSPPDITGLPALPDGWTWATPVQLESSIANAMAIGPFGSNLRVPDYRPEGVPLIFVRNIRSKSFNTDDGKFVLAEKAQELASHIARAGDVLVTKMGDPPGDACVYPVGSPDAIITADCIKWTLHPLLASREYFAEFINSALGRSQIAVITKGVAQQKVSLERFRQIAIALPGPEEQAQIAERLDIEAQRLSRISDAMAHEKRRSSAARQSILRAAFSGMLVGQDPSDEPASTLLERIAAERGADTATSKRSRKKKIIP